MVDGFDDWTDIVGVGRREAESEAKRGVTYTNVLALEISDLAVWGASPDSVMGLLHRLFAIDPQLDSQPRNRLLESPVFLIILLLID
jgi:hypothetical protein